MSDQSEPNRRDIWDKLDVIGSPLIAAVGLLFTAVYSCQQDNERTLITNRQNLEAAAAENRKLEIERDKAILAHAQLKLQQVDTIQKLYPELVHPNKNRRALALRVIQRAQDEKFAIELAAIFNEETLGELYATPSTRTKSAPVAVGTPGYQKVTRNGWVYMGDFDAARQRWRTRYLAFDVAASPNAIRGSTEVRSDTGAVNVRIAPPAAIGGIADVIDILPSGEPVTIRGVKRSSAGYYWAEIAYEAVVPVENPK